MGAVVKMFPFSVECIAAVVCSLEVLKESLYSLCRVRPPDGMELGMVETFLRMKHSPYMSRSRSPFSTTPHFFTVFPPHRVAGGGGAAPDDFAGVSRLPLSSSCLRSPAPIGPCTGPASKLRTRDPNSGSAPNFTSVVASSWPTASAGQAGPVQDFSNVPTQGLKAPEAHTPLL